MSSVTNIWPEQFDDAPIPKVGMFISLIISLTNFSLVASMTIAKTPELTKLTASRLNFFFQNHFSHKL